MNKWDKRFMELAENIACWSSCCRPDRQVGAVIVKDRRILTTGYNGAPEGIKSCVERKVCIRQENNIPSGTHAEFCYSVHAEQNAICQAARLGVSVKDATIYVTHQPCVICAKILINAGIKRIVYKYGYPDKFSLEIINEAGLQLDRYEDLESKNENL